MGEPNPRPCPSYHMLTDCTLFYFIVFLKISSLIVFILVYFSYFICVQIRYLRLLIVKRFRPRLV